MNNNYNLFKCKSLKINDFLQEFVETFDKDKDDKVSKEEFVGFLLKYFK